MRWVGALLLGACLAATAWAAPPDKARLAALAAYKQDLLSVLALRGDTTHLLGAALLARSLGHAEDREQAARLLRRAARNAPDDPTVTWLQLIVCGEDEGCDRAPLLGHLQQQAGDNAAIWLLTLGQAARDQDPDAIRAAFTAASQASRYDDYSGRLLQALSEAVTTLPVSPAARRAFSGERALAPAASVQAFLAYGEMAALPEPNFLPLMPLCDPEIQSTARENRAACTQLARVLAWGSSPRARAAGLHLQHVLASDEAGRQQAHKALQDLAWQVRNDSRLRLQALSDQALAVELLRLGESGGSQLSRMAALLHAHGVPLEQPAQPAVSSAAVAVPAPVPDRTAAPAPSASTAAPVAPAASTMKPPAPAPNATTQAPAKTWYPTRWPHDW